MNSVATASLTSIPLLGHIPVTSYSGFSAYAKRRALSASYINPCVRTGSGSSANPFLIVMINTQ